MSHEHVHQANAAAVGEGRSIGASVDRHEDPEILTGRAIYFDDIQRSDMVHMSILRSRYAHADIGSVDTSAAEERDGVLAVYTATDLDKEDIPGDIPCIYRVPDLIEPGHPLLARDRVRYQGKPIAVVVATDPYIAENATAAIRVDYNSRPVVTDPKAAVESDAPTLHDEAPNNVCFDWEIGDKSATDHAFESADHVFNFTFRNQRLVPNALEPRGAVAEFDGVSEELRVHMPSQNPFTHQEILADVLGHPKRKIRVVAPVVGGGFGSKSMFYPGEALSSFCAMQLERPVKWTATRTAAFVSDEHGRDQTIDAEIALNDDGTVQGLRVETFAALGGDLSSKGAVGPTTTFGPLVSGQYDIPAIHFMSHGIFTNTTPTAPYRGVGRAEAAFTIERSMTLAARKLGIDVAELRRRNFIQPDQFPYETAVGSVYDSGDYEAALDRALEMAGYDSLRDRQERFREEDRYLGIGISSFIEPGGFAPAAASEKLGMGLPDSTVKTSFWESSSVRVHETGEVTAYCGTASHGQGSETTHAQVVADVLGVDIDDVEVTEGKDTDHGLPGTGTFGSRAAVVGGNSLARSTQKVIEKGRTIAAHLLEASVTDIEFSDCEFSVTGAPQRSITLREVAVESYLGTDLPEDTEPGLEASTFYNPQGLTWSFGTHLVVVEVEPESGEIEIERYIGVDDCGTQINPKIVEGQLQGGIAQGIGAALYEGAVYDDNGQLINGSFQDYAIPKAENVPKLELDSTVTPSPLNDLGVKGVGESGTVGAPPAIVDAVTDALQPFSIDQMEMPLTPQTVWQAIEDARTE